MTTATATPATGARLSDMDIVRECARWYAVGRPREIVATYMRYAAAFGEWFSIVFLLKTLLSPWKSITDDYPSRGLNLEAIASAFFLNLTSRMIGFAIRVGAIVLGLCIQLMLLAGFGLYLILWLAYPLLLALAVPILISLSL